MLLVGGFQTRCMAGRWLCAGRAGPKGQRGPHGGSRGGLARLQVQAGARQSPAGGGKQHQVLHNLQQHI